MMQMMLDQHQTVTGEIKLQTASSKHRFSLFHRQRKKLKDL